MPMAIVGKPGRGAIWSNNYEKKPYMGRLGNTALPDGQRRDNYSTISALCQPLNTKKKKEKIFMFLLSFSSDC